MHNPLDQFKIIDLFHITIGSWDISFTNSALFMLIALLVSIIFMYLGTRRADIIPKRMQSATEMLWNMTSNMVSSTSGDSGVKFVPFIFTLFLFILICNLLGMVPYSFTVTSHIAVTFGLAIFIFISITLIGFIKHGTHFLSLFLPSGTPIIMAPLMIFIELFAYLARPVSLSIRLAANMTAGHIILKILASMVIMSGIFGILPFTLLTILSGFEIFIAVLQAYIFTILSCVYLSDALNLH